MATHCALEWYEEACSKHKVKKPNPFLAKFFREDEPIAEDIEDIDLAPTYIGNRGILALCDVIERLPNFRALSIAGQKLYNTDLSDDSVKGNVTVDRVVDVLKSHPSATALDISSNPVSNYAGRKLLALAQINHNMCKIELGETRIDFQIREQIKDQLSKNLAETLDRHADDGEEDHGGFAAFSEDSEAGGFAPKKKAPDMSNFGGGGVRRKTVRSEGVDPEKAKRYVAPVIEKPSEDVDMIVAMLKANVLFSFLGQRELRVVALAMDKKTFEKGDDILTQNGVGDALYVLQSGTCDILKEGQRVFVKTPGTAVGELELMYDSPCAATVRVVSDGGAVTWKLDRDTYRNLVMGTAIRRREEYSQHLDNIAFMSSLSQYEKTQVADALSSNEWQDGDEIIKYDQEGEWMFLILEGTVEVIGRADGKKTKVCEFSAGEYFGDLEFLNPAQSRTVADVVAKGYVRTAKLNRLHFEMCFGPVLEVLKRNTEHPKFEYYRKVLEGSA